MISRQATGKQDKASRTRFTHVKLAREEVQEGNAGTIDAHSPDSLIDLESFYALDLARIFGRELEPEWEGVSSVRREYQRH